MRTWTIGRLAAFLAEIQSQDERAKDWPIGVYIDGQLMPIKDVGPGPFEPWYIYGDPEQAVDAPTQ